MFSSNKRDSINKLLPVMSFGNFTLHCKALWSATRLQTRKTRCQQKAPTLKTIFRFQQLCFSCHWWWVFFHYYPAIRKKGHLFWMFHPKFLDLSVALMVRGGYNTKKDEGTASVG